MKSLKFGLIALCAVIFVSFSALCYGFEVVQVTNTPDKDEARYSTAVFGNTVYAVWLEPVGPYGYDLYFDKSIDMGKTWGEFRKIIEPGVIGLVPRIFIGKSGNLTISYGASEGLGTLRFLSSTDDGETFAKKNGAISIQGLRWYLLDYDVAVDETGDIIYVGRIIDYGRTFISKSINGGDSFTTPIDFWAESSGIEIQTSLDGKEVYLFLVGSYGTGRRLIKFKKSLDYGDHLEGSEILFPPNAGDVYDPGRYLRYHIDSTVDKDGRIYIAWASVLPNQSGRPVIMLSESADKGVTFTHTQVNDTNTNGSNPAVCADETGKVYLAFLKNIYNSSGISQSIYFDKRDNGGQFGRDVLIADPLMTPPPNTQIYGPAIAANDSDNTCIIWNNSSTAGGNRDIYYTTISDLPDLTLGDIIYSPKNPIVSQTVTFNVPVKNIGTAPAVGKFVVRFISGQGYAEGDPDAGIINVIVDGLAAGATKEVSFQWQYKKQGIEKPFFCADFYHPLYGPIEESNEDNNSKELTINVLPPPLPDLTLGNITYLPVNPRAGQYVTFTVPVKNIGAAVAENFTVRFFSDDGWFEGEPGAIILNKQIAHIDPGQTIPVTFQCKYLQAGTYQPIFNADHFHEVAESNEDNNGTKLNINVLPARLPDLTLGSIIYWPTSPRAGQYVTFRVPVKNIGTAVAGAFTLRFFSDPIDAPAVDIVNKRIYGLGAGATTYAYIIWKARAGTHRPIFVADLFHEVNESNEDNNVSSIAIDVRQ